MTDSSTVHRSDDIIALFDGLFAAAYNTRLVRGDEEPLYLPADAHCAYHRILFAHGFFASALHEISHWCIAGHRRRQLEDYGYWYLPDGRDGEQQRAFEAVEIKPQALELLLSRACDHVFRVSVDNLQGASVDRHAFQARVEAQAARYVKEGMPPRAAALRVALDAFYGRRALLGEAVAAGRHQLRKLGG